MFSGYLVQLFFGSSLGSLFFFQSEMENPRPKRSVCSTQKSDFTYAKSPAQKQQQASSPDQKPPPLKRRRLSPLEQKPPADPPTNDPKKPEKTGASGRTPPPPSSSPSRYPQDVIDWVRRATGLFERKMNAALTANVVQDPEKKVSIDVLSFSEAKLWALLFDPSVSHREFKRIQFDPKIPTHKKKNVLWKKDYRSVRELEGRLGSNFYRCNKGVNVTGVYLQSP